MKLNWNSLGEGVAKQNTFLGGSINIFWNCTVMAPVRFFSLFVCFLTPIAQKVPKQHASG